jgi:hypothetical protein
MVSAGGTALQGMRLVCDLLDVRGLARLPDVFLPGIEFSQDGG